MTAAWILLNAGLASVRDNYERTALLAAGCIAFAALVVLWAVLR